MTITKATRLDIAKISSWEKTHSGYLRVKANLSRTGIFPYRRMDGSQVMEYRSEDEVFSQASIDSSDLLPMTVQHPPQLLTPDNVTRYKIGSVVGTAKREGDFLSATIQIDDAQAIRDIEAGKLTEISCGYTADIVHKPGSVNGQKFDSMQTNIVLNHASLLQPGQGRQGSTVGIRNDSSELFDAILIQRDSSMKITIDGTEYEVDAAVADAFAKMKEFVDANQPNKDEPAKEPEAPAEGSPAEEKAEPAKEAKAEGDKPAETEKKDSVEPAEAPKETPVEPVATLKQDAVEPQETVVRYDAAQVEAMLELIQEAQTVVDNLQWKGKTHREIQSQVVLAANPTVKLDGKSDDYVAGLYAATVTAHKVAPQNRALREFATIPGGSKRNDSKVDAEDILRKARENVANRPFVVGG